MPCYHPPECDANELVYACVHIEEAGVDDGGVTHLGTRELRANLASYVRAAQSGHRIVVTVDGLPVAELGPVGGGAQRGSLDALVATGLLEAPRRTDRPAGPPATPLPAGLTSERALMELRGR